jgi:hypothetical protein
MSDVNRYGDEYVPYQGGYTIEELVDLVQNELTISCALPKTLPDANIRQIIETRALPWFYRSYQYAVQKLYYFIDKQYYRLYELDFDSNSEEPAKLTLLKLAVAPQFVGGEIPINGGGGGDTVFFQDVKANGNDFTKDALKLIENDQIHIIREMGLVLIQQYF